MRAIQLISILALGSAAGGCIDTIEQEKSRIGELVRDCVVPPAASVKSLDAPVGLEYPNGSLWIWSQLELLDGRRVANGAAFVQSAEDVCQHGPDLWLEANGDPRSLLTFSEHELADNQARTDGRHLELTPVGGFVHDDQGFLFYEHRLVGPGVFDSENLGTGLCVRTGDEPNCERIVVADSTLLWPGEERVMNSGGLLSDDRALVLGCKRIADFLRVCTLSGAPLDSLSDPKSYQYLSYFDGFIDDPLRASVISQELGSVTLSSTDVGFFATTLDLFDAHVYVRLSDHLLSEAFDHRIELFGTELPSSGFTRGGREHAGLRREPQTLHISYETDAVGAAGLHLASFRFFGKFGGLYQ